MMSAVDVPSGLTARQFEALTKAATDADRILRRIAPVMSAAFQRACRAAGQNHDPLAAEDSSS